MILLNPGPVTLSAPVRAALAGEDLCHPEPEFAALTLEVRSGIEAVYGAAGYAAVPLTGSGTCAVEAMLATLAPRERGTLVLCNGVYGERMLEMLRRQGKPATALQMNWPEPLDESRLEQALQRDSGIGCVVVVHHETTTGRLNALDGIAAQCRARGIGLLIDAVSSFGAEDLPLERWQPLGVAGTANKCLHGAPGICFVLARREALAPERSQSTSLYLDLAVHHREQIAGWSPFTQATHVMRALHAALQEHAGLGGWEKRRSLYLSRSTRVRAALARRGVEPLLPAAECASMLTAFRLPAGDSYERLHADLKRRGFVIYAGQGGLREQIFRIATMGDIPEPALQQLESALDEVFASPC